jgi:hypothetical protein
MLAALLATAALASPLPYDSYTTYNDPKDKGNTCDVMRMKLCLLSIIPFDQRDSLNQLFSASPPNPL